MVERLNEEGIVSAVAELFEVITEPHEQASKASVTVLVTNVVTNLQRIADAQERIAAALEHANAHTFKQRVDLTDEEQRTIQALRNGTAVVQPASRRHM